MAGLLLLGADFVRVSQVQLTWALCRSSNQTAAGEETAKSEPQAGEWPVRALLVPACRGAVYPGLAGGLSQPFQASWRMAPAGRRQGRDDSAIA